jgi:hypothetical protein
MMEKHIERKLVEGIRKLGGVAVKFASPGSAGWPDRLIIIRGRVIFVELKTATGRLSPMQAHRLEQLVGLGMWVDVLKGDNEVKEFLDEIARLPDARGTVHSGSSEGDGLARLGAGQDGLGADRAEDD